MSKATGIKGCTPDQLRRRTDAASRKATHEHRSPEEQLKVLDSRPGQSKKERARLS